MEKIKKFFSEIRKIFIAAFSSRYIYTNGGESRGEIFSECPKCGANEENTVGGRGGPMVWFGRLVFLGIFDTPIVCEEYHCATCGHKWNFIYY